ncbi:hypothetical protein AGMMS4957_08300 [Bacteroidia bacterium]|nr:hypothetical protein AGMMS4957_08300 [Bacteroidia bacterium]
MSVSMGLFCACSSDNQVPEYRIQAGVARVSGKVSGSLPFEINEQTGAIALSTNNPLIAYDIQYDATIQADGTFVLDVPVACTHLGYIRFDFYEGFIYLSPGDETRLDISFAKNGEKHISMLSNSRFTGDDMTNIVNVMLDFFTNAPRGSGTVIIQPEEFSKETMEKIEKMSAMVKRHTELSEAAGQFVTNSLKLMYVVNSLFAYEESMRSRDKDANEDAKEKNDFTPLTPEKSYYACLKQFDLNNSAYLFCDYYFMTMQAILSDKVLNIPPIGDTPIPDWLKEVKAIIADYIGADTGLFYDVLAANAYSKQFKDGKLLSDKQKENIRHYYTENTSFAEILFARDKDLAK